MKIEFKNQISLYWMIANRTRFGSARDVTVGELEAICAAIVDISNEQKRWEISARSSKTHRSHIANRIG